MFLPSMSWLAGEGGLGDLRNLYRVVSYGRQESLSRQLECVKWGAPFTEQPSAVAMLATYARADAERSSRSGKAVHLPLSTSSTSGTEDS